MSVVTTGKGKLKASQGGFTFYMFWVQHNFIFSSVPFKYTFIDSKKFTVKPKYISIKPRVSRYRWTRRSWHVWQLRKPSANVSTGLFLNQNLIKLNCIITLTNYTLITEDFLVEKHKSCHSPEQTG